MRFQNHCKICRSELAWPILFLHVCENFSYEMIIERYKHVLDLNLYNVSTHFNRHVQQKDIDEVEETKRRWQKAEAELNACYA